MSKKKIVYLSADMGAGHNSAVKALTQAVEKYYPGQFEHKVINVVALLGPTLDKVVGSLYKNMATYSKLSYKAFFKITDKSDAWSFLDKNGYNLIRADLKAIIREEPDLIISCFPLLSYSLSRYLKEKKVDAPFISLITDTGEVHSAWLCDRIDYYLASTKETGFYLTERGIDKDKVKVLGFPVQQSFYKKYNKQIFLEKNAIPQDKKILLYFGGAWGSGKLAEKVEELDSALSDVVLFVVCGKNSSLEKTLAQGNYKNDVRILGFIDNVAEMMSASDLIISKAGGLSTMEVVTMKKPVIITEVVPGQEEPNARMIESMGFGYVEKKPQDLARRAKYILENNDLERMSRNLEAYHMNEDADRKIADFMAEISDRKHIEGKKPREASTHISS